MNGARDQDSARIWWLLLAAFFGVPVVGCASSNAGLEPVALAPVDAEANRGPTVDSDARYSAAMQAIAQQDWEQAEAAALDVLRVDAGAPGALLVLAEVRARSGQLPEALELAQRAWAAGVEREEVWIEAADWTTRLFLRLGRAKEAEEWLVEVVAQHPSRIDVAVLRLQALNAAGRADDVQSLARALLERDETNAGVMRALAESYRIRGQSELERFVLERALAVNPTDAVTRLALAGATERAGELRDAIRHLEAALEVNPRVAEVRSTLGALYQRMGDNEGAREHLEKAVAAAPGFAEAWLNLASAHRGLRDYRMAEDLYRKALLLDSSLGAAHYNLAVLYLESPVDGYETQERLEKSIDEWGTYRQYAKTPEELAEVERSIEEAKKLIEVERERREQELKQGNAPSES